MKPHRMRHVAEQIYDAALAPELWPAALGSAAACFGAVGAGYIGRNKRTGRVDWADLAGPSTEMKTDFVERYAALDPYAPLLGGLPGGHWAWLSACIPADTLWTDEWYNDFILKCQVGDMVGLRLPGGPTHMTTFGLHFGIGSARAADIEAKALYQLFETVAKAALLHDELRRAGWKSAIALQALDQLAVASIVADAEGRVIEMNPAAERIVRCGNGLTTRQGRLRAERVFEAAKLARLIAAAGSHEPSGAAAGRMLVGRGGGKSPLTVSVAPLTPQLSGVDHRFVLILVVCPEDQASSADDWAKLYGLSPAESRLAAALMAGNRLSEIAARSGVRISTLRTQLSAILRKVGVERQADLVRVLSKVGAV
jgi:DNA-binding CsgD family transcriptional regulator